MAQRLSIITSPSTFTWGGALGDGHSKSQPEAVSSGEQHWEETRRVMYSFLTLHEFGAVLTTEFILGNYVQDFNNQQIQEFTSTRITETNTNGHHIWLTPNTITTYDDGNIVLTGDSIDEDGTVSAADTETITIANGTGDYYVSDKRWQGSVVLSGDNEGVDNMDVNITGGIVDPWNHAQMIRKMEAGSVTWRPSDTTWQFQWLVQKFTAPGTLGGGGGTSNLVNRAFTNLDATPRASNGRLGMDWDSRIDDYIDPTANSGYLVKIRALNVDFVQGWISFYEW